MLQKLIFALEKLAALLSSQRTWATIGSVILFVVALQVILAGVFGWTPWQAPAEGDVVNQVGEWLTIAITLIGAIVTLLKLISPLVPSFIERPPTNDKQLHNENIRAMMLSKAGYVEVEK